MSERRVVHEEAETHSADLVGKGCELRVVREVDVERAYGDAMLVGTPASEVVQPVAPARDDHEVPAVPSQPFCVRLADSGRGTCNHRKPGHA